MQVIFGTVFSSLTLRCPSSALPQPFSALSFPDSFLLLIHPSLARLAFASHPFSPVSFALFTRSLPLPLLSSPSSLFIPLPPPSLLLLHSCSLRPSFSSFFFSFLLLLLSFSFSFFFFSFCFPSLFLSLSPFSFSFFPFHWFTFYPPAPLSSTLTMVPPLPALLSSFCLPLAFPT